MGTGKNINVVRLMGGLGNQMFQYALGRRLSTEKRLVRFDVGNGFLHDFYGRKYALDAFQTQIAVASPTDIPLGMGWRSPWNKMAKAGWTALPQDSRRVFYERDEYNYDAAVVSTGDLPGRYYFGYWQCERYFSPIEDLLRDEFTLRNLSPSVSGLMQEMAGGRSVSVHVRRNHGIGKKGKVHRKAKELHGACDASFFQRAAAEIGVTSDTVYYVFSDNPDWAKANLKLPGVCRYITDRGSWSDAQELMLMAACQHHVISNSSFSWWGAWLGRNPTKVVVAPKIWLAGLPPDRINIYPTAWYRL